MSEPIKGKYKHSEVVVNLIKENNFKKVAEIGVWKSKTCRWVLRQCGDILTEYWAIDQWRFLGEGYGSMGKMTQEEWDNLYKGACKYMLYFPQLRVVKLPSVEAARLFPREYFDLVYIDADHYYDFIKADIKAWLPLVRPGGILAGHDYASRRHPDVKVAVDEAFGEDGIIAESGKVWIRLIK